MVEALYFVCFFPLGALGASKENPPLMPLMSFYSSTIYLLIYFQSYFYLHDGQGTRVHVCIRKGNALDHPRRCVLPGVDLFLGLCSILCVLLTTGSQAAGSFHLSG